MEELWGRCQGTGKLNLFVDLSTQRRKLLLERKALLPLDGKVDETPFAKAWDLYARASQMIFVAVLLILLLVANFSLPAAVVLFAWLAAYALVVPPEVQTPLYITISTPSPPAEPAAIWYCGGGCGCDGIRVVKSESAAAPAAAEPGATEPAAAADAAA